MASREIPVEFVFESSNVFAIKDIAPQAPTHVLVIPKREVDYIFDLSGPELGALWQFAQGVAKAVEKAVPCKRVGVAVIGLEVPHAHIHLVPLQTVGDINFTKEKLHPSESSLAEMAALIRANLQG